MITLPSATTTQARLSEQDLPFIDHWTSDTLSGNLPSWVKDRRQAGFARYQMLGGIPSSRIESWRYTSLKPLARQHYQAVGESPSSLMESNLLLMTEGLLSIPGSRLVLVNGRLVSDFSFLSDDIDVHPFDEIFMDDSYKLHELLPSPEDVPAMAALNIAWLHDGLAVRFNQKCTKTDQLLHIVLVSTSLSDGTPIITHPCLVITAKAGSRTTLIESHIGLAPSLTNLVTTVRVGAGATLIHVLAQSGASDANMIGFCTTDIAASGSYQRFILTTGLGLVRNELSVVLSGVKAECYLHGGYTADGNRHVDNTITIDHAAPATTSRQMFKGVLADKGCGVFQGHVIVRPTAQKSDSQQIHKALLLSQQSEVNCKPELEIYADDVRCSHGATVGQLEEDALFYLSTRGLDANTARDLLIEAFLSEIIDTVAADVPILHEAARVMISDWITSRATALSI